MDQDEDTGDVTNAETTNTSSPQSFVARLLNPPPLITVLRLSGTIGRIAPMRTGIVLKDLDWSIRKAFRPHDLAAVALTVNSPGGSAAQSSLIARRVRALADAKGVPVLAFCEDVAASGGYWLATAADEIYADPASIIGSIGVSGSGFGFVDLLEKLGIERRLHTAGKRKGMLDPFMPEKRDDVHHLDALQKDIHKEFCDWVRLRRGERLTGSDEDLFSGLFWSGRTALDLGLVDGLGEMHAVLQDRYGEHVRIKPINGQRPWLRRIFPFIARENSGDEIAHGQASAALAVIEERLIWNRFGL